jgi:hypothetical protein
MTLSETLKTISADIGLVDQDCTMLVNDEHARYDFYIKAIAMAPPPDDSTLLRVVLRDPDRAMGEAAAIELITRRAQRHTSHRSFASWAATVSDAAQNRMFLSKRIQEWSEFKRITESGRLSPDSLEQFSDWLQRKISEDADSAEVLATLAELGRTKRIRNISKQRLERRNAPRLPPGSSSAGTPATG